MKESDLIGYGLMIQKEHPLHEGVIYYLDVSYGDKRGRTGEAIREFWRERGFDPLHEGRGGRAKVLADASAIIELWNRTVGAIRCIAGLRVLAENEERE